MRALIPELAFLAAGTEEVAVATGLEPSAVARQARSIRREQVSGVEAIVCPVRMPSLLLVRGFWDPSSDPRVATGPVSKVSRHPNKRLARVR